MESQKSNFLFTFLNLEATETKFFSNNTHTFTHTHTYSAGKTFIIIQINITFDLFDYYPHGLLINDQM